MKIALLGKGKTGGKVLELLIEKKIPHTVFDSKNHPTLESLKGHDVVISFLTGDVFGEYMPLLIDAKIPVVTGSTGISFGNELANTLQKNNIKWIYATNFSLGMNLVHQMILIMKNAGSILSDYSFSMNEIHHTKKLDAPSGTALSWKNWAGHEMNITSERIGDVIGIHELTLKTATEEITLKHTALDRKIFAEGALYAANIISTLTPGLHLFQDVVQKELLKGIK
nr:dihydrodipicolinate reductase domain/dihydrodipicolinate reductase domain multi-domain protein [Bacteriovorax sp. HI3]